jgi:hypothetical protein
MKGKWSLFVLSLGMCVTTDRVWIGQQQYYMLQYYILACTNEQVEYLP